MASSGTQRPPPMPDLCTTRQSKTQRFAGPTFELICQPRIPNAVSATAFHVPENVLKSSRFEDLILPYKMNGKRTINVSCEVEIFTMVVEFLYTGEYSPTMNDIECMDPDVRDTEAKTQLKLYNYANRYNENRLMDLAMRKIAACEVSPNGFLDLFSFRHERRDTSSFSDLQMLYATWIKDHLHELLASKELKRLLLNYDEGDDIEDVLNLLGSYRAILEGGKSLKRGVEGESDSRPSKAPRRGESTT